MTINNEVNEFYFDQILVSALKQHSEPVPSDFNTNIQMQIRKAQEQRILARIIWQERLTLVGSIALAGLATFMIVVFLGSLTKTYRNVVDSLAADSQSVVSKTLQVVNTISGDWQLYAISAVISLFALYSLIDFLTSYKIRIT